MQAASIFQRVNSWFDARLGWLALVVALAGFALRMYRATESYYNGDEAQNMFPPLQAGIANVWRGALVFPYGPLGNLITYFQTFLGNSEWFFRMPPVIAGSLIPLVVYRWVGETFNRTAGFAAACLLAFSPNWIHLSAELRHYALQALCMAASLWFLERALRDGSLQLLRWYGAAQVLALLSMYMSIWYILGIAIYALLRMWTERMRGRFLVEWAAIQAISAGICLLAYFTHLIHLQGTQGETFARDVWLRSSYFHPEAQSVFHFLIRSTGSLLSYATAHKDLALLLGVLFLIGLGVAWRSQRGSRRLATLSLVLPLVTTAAAAIVSLYPYGGTRHAAFLVVFLAAGAGIGIAFLARHSVVVVLALTVVMVPAWIAFAQRGALHDDPKFERLEQMRGALAFFSNVTPQPEVIVLDQISATIFKIYVCRGQIQEQHNLRESPGPTLTFFRCAGHQVLIVQEWSLPEFSLAIELARARTAAPGLLRGRTWYFHISSVTTEVFQPPRPEEAWFGKIHLAKLVD